MGCLGNHEMAYNGTHYTERLQLYNQAGQNSVVPSNNNWWFSWEYVSGGALIHMTAISSEVYYSYSPDLTPQREAQFNWLQKDLSDARSRNVDWLIVYGHRPLYCSNIDDIPDCWTDAETLRTGKPSGKGDFGIEKLLEQFNVDVYLCGHEHSYERSFPVLDGQIEVPEGDNHTYINPSFPVHLLSGAAGNQEELDYYDRVLFGPWSAFRSSSYGFGHLLIYNSTHLYWDQIINEGRDNTDYLWIIKDKENFSSQDKIIQSFF